jgi:chromosomal replication initiation ATPase DnaA
MEIRRRFLQAAPPAEPVRPAPVKRVVPHIPTPRDRRRQIEMDVAQKHGVAASEFASTTRQAKVVAARSELFYRLNKELAFSLARIGRLYGRDHTTVLHSVRRFVDIVGQL